MIIVGWGKKTKILGPTIPFKCPNCNNETLWQVVELSNNVRLYFVPVAKWNSQYYHICPVCTFGQQLKDRKEAQDLLLEALQAKEKFKSEMLQILKENEKT